MCTCSLDGLQMRFNLPGPPDQKWGNSPAVAFGRGPVADVDPRAGPEGLTFIHSKSNASTEEGVSLCRLADTHRTQVVERDEHCAGSSANRTSSLSLKCDHKLVRAAPCGWCHSSCVHFGSGSYVAGCLGEFFKIGPALSLTPKGGAGARSIGYQRQWSTTRIPLTSAPLTSASLALTLLMSSTPAR